ncbi:MAG: FHA domain-containing protein [Planctomycetota bacterium]|nr:FHA domain-containing protein [Planctomycetota bacterium]
MEKTARLAVRIGPDQGQVFPLATELVRIGRGADNEIVLTDPWIADHHASIVHREGRYAIVTAHPAGLQIDETPVPPERWIWLPEEASIRISPHTVLTFELHPHANGDQAEPAVGSETGTITMQPTMEGFGTGNAVPTVKAPPRAGTARPRRGVPPASPASAEGGAAKADPPPAPSVKPAPGPTAKAASDPAVAPANGESPFEALGAPPGSSDRVPRPRKPGEKKGRQTAKFIAEGPDAALVKLGGDGTLPELALIESAAAEAAKNAKRETNPLILIGAMVVSLSMTLVMLFMDDAPNANQTHDKAAARQELREYYGAEGDTSFAPYQLGLRRARQAFTRRDSAGEQAELRKVLNMLRSESKDKMQRFTGVTGRVDYDYDDISKRSDRRLEELIAALLADD